VSLKLDEPVLEADFYARPVVDVARELIGCTLMHGDLGGVIVETEAYHQSESSCHAYRGPTPRAKTLFAAPGTAYVYFSYGVHTLLNAVAEPEGVGAAVLIRALAPVHGVDEMIRLRGRDRPRDLCSGPGKLTQALAIGLDLNESALTEGPLKIHAPAAESTRYKIATSPRIGISSAIELPWRFYAEGVEHVSRPR
jgi:DNA-3-methyladenine glycosylase